MQIFRDYTTDELVMNLPCDVGSNILIYPIKVKDYKRFGNYVKYTIFSKKHLGIGKEMSLLSGMIWEHTKAITKGSLDLTSPKTMEAMSSVLRELEGLFSLILRTEITQRVDGNGRFIFVNKEKKIEINENNFELIRMVVNKMNMLREPHIFEREIDRLWHEKALIAKRSQYKNPELGEILTIVRNTTHESYETISEMNIFQLYSDYYRIQQVVNHQDTALFATVSEKMKVSSFIDTIVDSLYRDPMKDLTVENDFTQFM